MLSLKRKLTASKFGISNILNDLAKSLYDRSVCFQNKLFVLLITFFKYSGPKKIILLIFGQINFVISDHFAFCKSNFLIHVILRDASNLFMSGILSPPTFSCCFTTALL